MTADLPEHIGPDSHVTEGPDPKWLQLAAILTARVQRGDFANGKPLPSLAALTREYDVSRGTAYKSLVHLAERGVIRLVNGKGAWPVGP